MPFFASIYPLWEPVITVLKKERHIVLKNTMPFFSTFMILPCYFMIRLGSHRLI